MLLSLIMAFATCFATGALCFTTNKITKLTWMIYFTMIICAIPSFLDIFKLI
jgi:hypothetical protein